MLSLYTQGSQSQISNTLTRCGPSAESVGLQGGDRKCHLAYSMIPIILVERRQRLWMRGEELASRGSALNNKFRENLLQKLHIAFRPSKTSQLFRRKKKKKVVNQSLNNLLGIEQ